MENLSLLAWIIQFKALDCTECTSCDKLFRKIYVLETHRLAILGEKHTETPNFGFGLRKMA